MDPLMRMRIYVCSMPLMMGPTDGISLYRVAQLRIRTMFDVDSTVALAVEITTLPAVSASYCVSPTETASTGLM